MKLFEQFKNAIEEEQQEDISQTDAYISMYSPKKLSQLGLAIINLQVANLRTGLGAKTILELKLDPAYGDNDINTGVMRTGDIVKLSKMDKSTSSSGKKKKSKTSNSSESSEETEDMGIEAVVLKVSTQTITISVEESTDDAHVLQYYNNTSNESTRVWLVKLTNSITYKRMISTMNKVNELQPSDKNDIHKVLLGESKYISHQNNHTLTFFNPCLNESQKQAIEFAINKSDITIIHGPPGTGKTYTLVELIQQLTNLGEKVLVCGPSNISVDTILERLGDKYKQGQLIRIGHPARLLPVNLQHSLEIMSKSYGREIISGIDDDISATLTKIRKCKRYAERRELYQELKTLKRELKQRQKKIVHELLSNARVIVATLHGSGSYELRSNDLSFDTIIIDEVSQSMEPQCWIPLLLNSKFKRLVIAGDNMQLPPTIKSVKKKGSSILETTLFDRLVRKGEGSKFKKLLDVQYRMNTSIVTFPNIQLYSNKLKSDTSVQNITLSDLPGVKENEDTLTKCIWYDTQGGEFPEQISESIEGDSKFNEMELLIVKGHIENLLSHGIQPKDIGVIAPYAAQVQLFKKQMGPESEIEISTVDGFQGREKEVIILTLVRSNDAGEIGFLSDQRRLNVAITRPKRQLCVIGDLELMSKSGSNFLQNWCKYVEEGIDRHDVEPYQIVYPNLEDYL
ncbi:DNA polymerase alpha-associated DNA helicase A [Spathaspora sp. JA1]|nr:DNA polymerase alpha-associated DNA helicase A [Spathaspora sp. JA1]